MGNYIINSNRETRKKIEGLHQHRNVIDSGNMRTEETSRRRRRMEATSEGGKRPEGVVAPWKVRMSCY
jgi:hypothetical protein